MEILGSSSESTILSHFWFQHRLTVMYDRRSTSGTVGYHCTCCCDHVMSQISESDFRIMVLIVVSCKN